MQDRQTAIRECSNGGTVCSKAARHIPGAQPSSLRHPFLTESPRHKMVRFFHSERENFFEASKWIEPGRYPCSDGSVVDFEAASSPPATADSRNLTTSDFPGSISEHVMRSKFCPNVLGVHRIRPPMHDVFVKRILHKPWPLE